MQVRGHRLAVALAVLVAAGCGDGAAQEGAAATDGTDRLRVELDKSAPERLMAYYLGSSLDASRGDAFEQGVLERDGDGLWYRPAALRRASAGPVLDDADGDGVVSWDELAAWVDTTYAAARSLPSRLERLVEPDTTAWFTIEVDGVMTTARRRVSVPLAALRAAVEGYQEAGGALLYPDGTLIVGRHYAADTLVETTIMRRRGRRDWDFGVYDAAGRLAASTHPMPRALESPTQCLGCHVGSKRFEPEASFPAPARPGPHGPRVLHARDVQRNREVVRFFDEHARRSDGVLGVYATLWVSELAARRDAGTIAPDDARLLDDLGL